MSAFHPLVSIVIPVYNGSNFLREAIDSALGQTYDNCEILVINDGSTDGGATERIALSYGDKIRYFSKENGGVATALNMGIEQMRGQYFSWLSHDDMYLPCKVAAQIEALAGLGKTNVVVYGDVLYIDASGQTIGNMDAKNALPEHMFWNHYTFGGLHGCSLLIPLTSLQQLKGFDESLPTTQDFDLWFRMLQIFSFYKQETVGVLSRVHPEQGSRINRDHLEAQKKLFLKYLPWAMREWRERLYTPSERQPIAVLVYMLRSQGSAFGLDHFVRAVTVVWNTLRVAEKVSITPKLLYPFVVSIAYYLPKDIKCYIQSLKKKALSSLGSKTKVV